MARTPTHGPANNWNLTKDQLENLRQAYLDEGLSIQQASRRVGISPTIAQQIAHYHKWEPPLSLADSEKP